MARYSQQRELIFNTVKQNPIHPSADDIYHIVKKDHPTISLGTVYRNLNYLSDNGYILKIQMPNGADRFDARTEEHYHIICKECGQVFDLSCETKDLKEKIFQQTGVWCTKFNLLAEGICKNCKSKHD